MEDFNKSDKRNKISARKQHLPRLNPRIKRPNRHGLPHETGLKIPPSKNKLASVTPDLKHSTDKRKRRALQSNLIAVSLPQKDPTGVIQPIQSGCVRSGYDNVGM